MARREIELGISHRFSGLDCRVTRKGLEIGGWYDSFVGIEGRSIPWDEFDEARRRVMGSGPLVPCSHEACSGIDDTPLNNPEKVWICDGCRRTGTMSELRSDSDGSHSDPG